MRTTGRRLILLAIAVAIGLGSRHYPIGIYFWDKTLGDAAYAAAVYLILGICFPRPRRISLAIAALLICIGIEFFKLTGLPARWASSAVSRVLFGTTFSWENMVVYAAAIATIFALDRTNKKRI
jgi:hypothetical protein